MTDFFARVRSIVRSEEKKVRAAHIKAQSPPPTRAAASPREDPGPELDGGSAAKIQLVKSASDVSIEDDKKKKKTSRSSSEDGSVKSSKSKVTSRLHFRPLYLYQLIEVRLYFDTEMLT